jgi:hypothetical protein
MRGQSSTVTRKFTGDRIQVDTCLSFDEVRMRLGDLLGHRRQTPLQRTKEDQQPAYLNAFWGDQQIR